MKRTSHKKLNRNINEERKSRRRVDREYWSRRPFSNCGGAFPCKETKIDTHRYERRVVDKKEINDGISDISDISCLEDLGDN